MCQKGRLATTSSKADPDTDPDTEFKTMRATSYSMCGNSRRTNTMSEVFTSSSRYNILYANTDAIEIVTDTNINTDRSSVVWMVRTKLR